MSSRAHTQALVAHLKADPDLAGIVFDGEVPGDAPHWYVLVFADRPTSESTRFARRRTTAREGRRIHCVSTDPNAAETLADKVKARLAPETVSGVRLIVGGVAQGVIEHDGGYPIRIDTEATPAVYFLADDYVWQSTP